MAERGRISSRLPSFAELLAAQQAAGGEGTAAQTAVSSLGEGFALGSQIAARRREAEKQAAEMELKKQEFVQKVAEYQGQSRPVSPQISELGVPTGTPLNELASAVALLNAREATKRAGQEKTQANKLEREKTLSTLFGTQTRAQEEAAKLRGRVEHPGLLRKAASFLTMGAVPEKSAEAIAAEQSLGEQQKSLGQITNVIQRLLLEEEQVPQFDTVAQAEAAQLPKGTTVKIKGRPAVIE